jgi:hypothetical protein
MLEAVAIVSFWILVMFGLAVYSYHRSKTLDANARALSETMTLAIEFLESYPKPEGHTYKEIDLMFQCWCFSRKLSMLKKKRIEKLLRSMRILSQVPF